MLSKYSNFLFAVRVGGGESRVYDDEYIIITIILAAIIINLHGCNTKQWGLTLNYARR